MSLLYTKDSAINKINIERLDSQILQDELQLRQFEDNNNEFIDEDVGSEEGNVPINQSSSEFDISSEKNMDCFSDDDNDEEDPDIIG